VIPLASGERFEAWTGQHLLVLAFTAAGVVAAVWWGRSHRDTPRELPARRTAAALSLLVIVGMQVYWLTPGARGASSSWPLQLSDVADYTAAYAMWTRGPRSTAFTYYVGLSLTLMAVLTPSLAFGFPDIRWFGFWIRHIVVVWAAVYLTWGLGIRPTWRFYRTTILAVLVWAAIVYPFNRVAGTNYGFLVRPPPASTPLDLFGPWPWYLLVAAAVLLTLWAAVYTLPWRLAVRRQPPERRTPRP